MEKSEKHLPKIVILFRLTFWVITVFTVFLFIFFLTRKPLYLVSVDKDIYNQYKFEELNSNKKLKIKFISDELLCSESTKCGWFGKIPLISCTVTKEKQLFDFTNSNPNKEYYIEENKQFVPCIPSDFTSSVLITNPNVNITLCQVKDMTPQNRALPVNSLYAGMDNYPLQVTDYIVITYFNDKYKEILHSVFTDKFTKTQETALSSKTKKPVFVCSVGDIMVARGTQDILIKDSDGLNKVFGTTLKVLQSNDLTIGNLEGVVTQSNKNAIKTYTFKFNKEVLPFLQKAGFNYLMQTNNHCYDYGEQGFKDTMAALKEYNIPTSGAGLNLEEAKKFYHTEINGTKFSVISIGAYPVENSGFNGKKTASATETRAGILWQSDEILEDIKKEKSEGYFVIVNIHGGQEYVFKPNKAQIAYYEALCDSGADVVFGSHPHVLQPVVWHNNSLIAYSLGNFIFNGMDGMKGATDSKIVRLGIIDNKIAYSELFDAKLCKNSVNLK